jgi:hypothetical protein
MATGLELSVIVIEQLNCDRVPFGLLSHYLILLRIPPVAHREVLHHYLELGAPDLPPSDPLLERAR